MTVTDYYEENNLDSMHAEMKGSLHLIRAYVR